VRADFRSREEESDQTDVYLCKWSNLTPLLWTPASLAMEYLDQETLKKVMEAPLVVTPAGKRKKTKERSVPEFWHSNAGKKVSPIIVPSLRY